MTETERRLQHALAADAAPAADPLFRVEVLARRHRAALRRRLVEAVGFAFVSAFLVVFVLQAVTEIFESRSASLAVTVILALGYIIVFALRYTQVPCFVRVLYARFNLGK